MNEDDFLLQIKDCQENTMDIKDTIGKLYKKPKMSMLRFYLVTSNKRTPEETNNIKQDCNQQVGQNDIHHLLQEASNEGEQEYNHQIYQIDI